jgi:hypothetical protein
VVVFLSAGVRDEREARWALYRDLMVPTSELWNGKLVRTDLSWVSDLDELRAAVREAVAYVRTRPGTTPEAAGLSLDWKSRSNEVLRVPADRRLLALGRAWVADADPQVRILGTEALAPFASGEGKRWLRGLYADPYCQPVESDSWRAHVEDRASWRFPVRQAALNVTKEFNLGVRTELPYQRYREVAWSRGAAWVVTVVAVVWLSLRRGARIGFMGWGAVASSIALVFIALTAWRAWRVVDTFSFAASGMDYEVSLAPGRVAVVRTPNGAGANGVLVRQYAPSSYPEGLWYEGVPKTLKGDLRWGGFRWVEGVDAVEVSYRFLWTPYWILAAAAGLIPVLWVTGRGRRAVRRWRWVRGNRCVECGYDLRGSRGRCPECGVEGRVVVAGANFVGGYDAGR